MLELKCLSSGSHGNCYIVTDGATTVLLDAGIKLKDIMVGCDFDLSGISGALITHNHKDHSEAVGDLIRRGVKVYGTAGTVVNYQEHDNAICFRPYVKYGLGTIDFVAVPMEHDVPCYGFWLKSYISGDTLLYATDTSHIPYQYGFVNQMLIEANYDPQLLMESNKPTRLKSRISATHMGIDSLVEYIQQTEKACLSKIYLCHLSDDNSDAEAFRKAVQEAAPQATVYVCGRNGGFT